MHGKQSGLTPISCSPPLPSYEGVYIVFARWIFVKVVLTRSKALVACLLMGFVAPVMGDQHYESVVKEADFRASLILPSGAAFAQLSEGFTYYRRTARVNCDTPDVLAHGLSLPIQLSEGFTYYRMTDHPDCDIPDVLVHGFSVPSYIWDPTYDFLASKGRCVIMLDLYGRGFSDNPDVAYTDHLFATQVLALLDKLGVERAAFFGLSNGGRVVSQIAGIAPERVARLIYVASSGFRDVTRAADTSVSQEEIDALIERYAELPAGQLSDFKDPRCIGLGKKFGS